MCWNRDKFQLLRVGPNREIKESTYLFSLDFEDVIEEKSNIKDLGILVDSDLRYKEQMKSAVSKANKKASWILRTFSNRSVEFMRKTWKVLVQCHLDYGSVLWAPVNLKGDLKYMEGPLRAFTKKAKNLYNTDYWQRLKLFKLYSNQRRNERYKILYIWKSLQNIVPSLGLSWNMTGGPRYGPKLTVDPIYGPNERVKNLKRDSIRNFGVRLFNMLPVTLRVYKGSLQNFKAILDFYLSQCPDQPPTEELIPEARDIYGDPSNSLIDWMSITKFVDPTDSVVEAQP